MSWTQFWDMHSGGGAKVKVDGKWKEKIYIEGTEEEARALFKQRFNRDPDHITCECCGPDYSVHEEESLNQLTAYHRGCWHDGSHYVEVRDTRYDKYYPTAKEAAKVHPHITPEQYALQDDVLIIPKS